VQALFVPDHHYLDKPDFQDVAGILIRPARRTLCILQEYRQVEFRQLYLNWQKVKYVVTLALRETQLC